MVARFGHLDGVSDGALSLTKRAVRRNVGTFPDSVVSKVSMTQRSHGRIALRVVLIATLFFGCWSGGHSPKQAILLSSTDQFGKKDTPW